MLVRVKRVVIPAFRIGEPDSEFLGALKKDIEANGMKVPILLDENHNIIDGLQRYRIAVDLDWDTIDAVIPSDWTEVLDWLHEAHKPDALRGGLSPRRVWQIKELADPYLKRQLQLMWEAPAARKAEFFTSRKWGENGFAKVLRMGGSQVHGAVLIYRTALEDTPLSDYARELVKLVDNRELGISGAYKRFKQYRAHIKGAPDTVTQRRMLDRIVSHLDSIEQALAVLGPLNPELTNEELEAWMKAMYRTNIPLFRLRNELRRKVSS